MNPTSEGRRPLHVYANDVTEWYVAESPEEAAVIAEEHMREGCGIDRDEMDLHFTLVPDDKVLTIERDVEKPLVGHGTGCVTEAKTCAEWAELNGKGFLATTEY